MRLFNTVQELWSYVAYCPLCREISDDPIINIALDTGDSGYGFAAEKRGSHIYAKLTRRPYDPLRKLMKPTRTALYSINYDIDCLRNTFTTSYEGVPSFPEEAYCYIQCVCGSCSYRSVYGADMKLDMETKEITNIGVERETIELVDNTDLYRIEIEYKHNCMLVYREIDNSNSAVEDQDLHRLRLFLDIDTPAIKLPIIEFDFSDYKKAVNKLKTLILFS